jgi:thymidylate synthase ThyX
MLKREQDGVKVILVDNIHPENAAMAQALYARSAASAEVVLQQLEDSQRAAFAKVAIDRHCLLDDALLDDVVAVAGNNDACARARRLHEQYAVNYGHLSILDCGFTYVFVEGVTELACKAIQHWPLFSGQQTSTRAVDVTKARIVDPLNTAASRRVIARWMDFHVECAGAVEDYTRERYPQREGESDKDYGNAVKYRSFDVRRGFLPAGLTTQTAVAMNLRQWSDHLTWLLVHPLEEVRRVARLIQAMLRERYPASGSFGGSAAVSGIGVRGTTPEVAAARAAWYEKVGAEWTYQDPRFRPHRSRPIDEVEFSTTVDLSTLDIDYYAAIFRDRPPGCVLPRFLDDLGTCTASFLCSWGDWRDIERQRAGTCRVPLVTPEYGFADWYLEQLPPLWRARAEELIDEQHSAICLLTEDEVVRQHYVAFGFRVPTTLTYSLPIWAYVLELRTGKTIHPALRREILKVAKLFRERFGARAPLHIDDAPDVWDMRRGKQVIEQRIG